MRGRTPAIVGILTATVLLVWIGIRPGSPAVMADLIDQWPDAADVRPSLESFTVTDATLAGDTRRAIVGQEPGRITWPVDLPDDPWLHVSVGMLEPSWTTEGDGSLFMVGVSDGQTYHELITLVMDPFANPDDRRWQNLLLDLSPYAGRRVDVIFNTRASPPQTPPANDLAGDMPAWGEPQIVAR